MITEALILQDEFTDNEENTYTVIIATPHEIVAKILGDGTHPDFNYFIFHRSAAGYWVDREDQSIRILEVL